MWIEYMKECLPQTDNVKEEVSPHWDWAVTNDRQMTDFWSKEGNSWKRNLMKTQKYSTEGKGETL